MIASSSVVKHSLLVGIVDDMHIFAVYGRSDDRDARIKTRDREVLARCIRSHLVLIFRAQAIPQCFIESARQILETDLVLSAIIGDAVKHST